MNDPSSLLEILARVEHQEQVRTVVQTISRLDGAAREARAIAVTALDARAQDEWETFLDLLSTLSVVRETRRLAKLGYDQLPLCLRDDYRSIARRRIDAIRALAELSDLKNNSNLEFALGRVVQLLERESQQDK